MSRFIDAGEVLLAPEDIEQSLDGRPVIFTAGSIDENKAEDWQKEFAEALEDVDCVILNPRRKNWDSSWKQEIENEQFREQVEWELDGMEEADVIALCLTKDSKAPISLLELGLHAGEGKLIVCCPDEFYRKGNVDIVCARYGVPVYEDFKEFVGVVKERIGFSRMVRRVAKSEKSSMNRFKNMAEKIAGMEKKAVVVAPKGMLLVQLSAVPNPDFRPEQWQSEVDIKPTWKIVRSLAEAQKAARNFIDPTPEIDVRKFDRGRIGAVEEKIDERTQVELMKRVSAALGYRLDSIPVRSTMGTGWTMTNQRDYLEIQVHFNLDGSAELAVLSLDLNSQEDLGSKDVADGGDVMALIRAAKELKAKVVGSSLVEHLRFEQGLNASRRSSIKRKGCDICGCGVIADSLIAPMSAEDKDAEAGPKEGPPMMTQPLRARRDYGSVASRVASFILRERSGE